MNRFPDDLLFSPAHLWVHSEDQSQVQIGVTEVFLAISGRPDDLDYLCTEGELVDRGQVLARIVTEEDEWEIVSPLKGRIVEFNLEVAEAPEILADDPYDEGWLIRLELGKGASLKSLLNASDYEDHVVDQLTEAELEDLDDEDFEEELELDSEGGFDDEVELDEEEEEEEEEEDY